MTLRFSARARRHIDAIQEYITERNPNAAARVGDRIRESAELLQTFPMQVGSVVPQIRGNG